MAKINILCGKICSGKSTFAKKLKNEINAVILSCDDLMLTIFDEQLGDRHNDVMKKCQTYLYGLAEQIIGTNTDVILDFGFWSKEERENIRKYFSSKNIEVQMYYVKVDEKTWLERIEKRNAMKKEGKADCYYVDENMKRIFNEMFEEPGEDEDFIPANSYL